jgi:hypothetical protein
VFGFVYSSSNLFNFFRLVLYCPGERLVDELEGDMVAVRATLTEFVCTVSNVGSYGSGAPPPHLGQITRSRVTEIESPF